MNRIKSFFFGSMFMFVFVTGIPTLLSFPSAAPRVSMYNEKDTDEVISSIEKYVGRVSSKLILDHLKNRLPEAKNNNLNIVRITDFLLETFKNDENAIFKIAQFTDYGLGKIKKSRDRSDFTYLKRNYNLPQ